MNVISLDKFRKTGKIKEVSKSEIPEYDIHLEKQLMELVNSHLNRNHNYIKIANDSSLPDQSGEGINDIDQDVFYSKYLNRMININDVISILAKNNIFVKKTYEFSGSYDADVKNLYLDFIQESA